MQALCSCHSLWEFIRLSVLLCLDDTALVESLVTSSNVSVSSSTGLSKLCEEGFDEDIPLGLSAPEFLTLRTVQLRASGLFTIYCKKQLC